MTILYIDKNGKRAQLADRAALVDALRRDEVNGATKVYVPAKNDFVALAEVFDIARLREGDTSRKQVAAPPPRAASMFDAKPAASRAGKPPKRGAMTTMAAVLGVLLVVGVVAFVATNQLEERRVHNEQARRQMADDLSRVTAQMRSDASAAASGVPSTAAGKDSAPLKSPVAQLISEHLKEMQSLSTAHERNVEKIAGDDLLTPATLTTREGIAVNRAKLVTMTRAIDEYFASVKRVKQDYMRRADELGARSSPTRDEKFRRILDFFERAHQANLRVMASMGRMNDFAEQHHPGRKGDNLVFKDEAELSRWRELTAALTQANAALEKLGAEGQQIEKGSVDELQQQIGKLRQAG